MTNQLALALGAAIIGLSIVGARLVGRYEISAASDSAVWRVDSLTGDVQLCLLTPSDNPFDNIGGTMHYVKCRQSVGGTPDVAPRRNWWWPW
jgi:hypothetical protein